MTQAKGFTIFARAWTASPPRKGSPLPRRREEEDVIDCSSSDSGSESASSVSSAITTITIPSSENITKQTRPRSVDFSILEAICAREQSLWAPASSPLWYILTAALLLAFHKEKLIGQLWTYLAKRTEAQDQDEEALLAIARQIREACLKASTLVGFPRAINALMTLQQSIDLTHPHISAALSKDSSSLSASSSASSLTPSQRQARGMSLFTKIYDKHTPRVLSTLSNISNSGAMADFAINCIYGELLSDDAVIGDLETGLLEFVCCLADGVGPQAKGHFFGSINLGADKGMLRAAIRLTDEVARQAGLPCPWEGGDEDEVGEWRFLDRVMGERRQ